jgi:hypothetical protein
LGPLSLYRSARFTVQRQDADGSVHVCNHLVDTV